MAAAAMLPKELTVWKKVTVQVGISVQSREKRCSWNSDGM
jgi:hypothetical protein